MKLLSLVLYLIFFPAFLISQNEISGKVSQKNGQPLSGVNVYISGTYDGGSTDDNGNFTFDTSEKGSHSLVFSFISFETLILNEDISNMKNLQITLREDVSSLDAVTISAGSFEANDNSKVSVLKPLDIVTTASALGDFVGALQTLPGTSTVAEDGRLFVRGGEASETQIFIDGIRVFTPYSPSANNVPTRGRYSPFLFDGITFSTGGYSAEYGQALSSILLLNTIEEEVKEKTDIALMSLGGGLGHTKKWEKSSLSINASYINLAPYNAIFSDRNEWQKPFESASGETVFRQKIGDGLLKLYAAFEYSNFQLTQEDIDIAEGVRFKLDDKNFYANASYKNILKNNWSVFTGGSFTHANTKVGIENANIKDVENSFHYKINFKKRFSNKFKMSFGAEEFITSFDENYNNENLDADLGFSSALIGVFTEADVVFSKDIALKMGLRGEYDNLNAEFSLSPRISFAYKVHRNGQLSLAYGDFFQQAEKQVLKFDSNIRSQHAQHYILNYQYTANNRIFRAELYRKDYHDLVTYNNEFLDINSEFLSNGKGFAQGLDMFFRDNSTFKNMDYWISYSYLDTKRKYRAYPLQAQPSFANRHNLSVVAKYWIESLRSQVGLSYQFASGRTYTDLNSEGFLQNKTKSYNNLSLNWAYLLSQQKILYFSVNNALFFKNVTGYQYSSIPNSNGIYARRELRPASDQFFFVGFFWTLSSDGRQNQLDNL